MYRRSFITLQKVLMWFIQNVLKSWLFNGRIRIWNWQTLPYWNSVLMEGNGRRYENMNRRRRILMCITKSFLMISKRGHILTVYIITIWTETNVWRKRSPFHWSVQKEYRDCSMACCGLRIQKKPIRRSMSEQRESQQFSWGWYPIIILRWFRSAP